MSMYSYSNHYSAEYEKCLDSLILSIIDAYETSGRDVSAIKLNHFVEYDVAKFDKAVSNLRELY